MNEPTEEICDALVEYVNGLVAESPSPLSLAVEASKPEFPSEQIVQEQDELKVFFAPSGEVSEKIGRGGQVLELFTVSMVVVRKLTDEFTRSRLGQFARELKVALRGVKQAGYTWSNDETTSPYDPDLLQKNHQFACLIRLSYAKAG